MFVRYLFFEIYIERGGGGEREKWNGGGREKYKLVCFGGKYMKERNELNVIFFWWKSILGFSFL